MTATRWPLVVGYLLTTLPTLPGWSDVSIFDTDPVTGEVPMTYAVVARTSEDTTSGNYVRLIEPSGLINESGTVRLHVVTRTGSVDPGQVRADGFALVDALEDAIAADQTLGGALGVPGVATLTVDVQSVANASGVAQSLIVSVNYAALTMPR
jgi:hypothetical protein